MFRDQYPNAGRIATPGWRVGRRGVVCSGLVRPGNILSGLVRRSALLAALLALLLAALWAIPPTLDLAQHAFDGTRRVVADVHDEIKDALTPDPEPIASTPLVTAPTATTSSGAVRMPQPVTGTRTLGRPLLTVIAVDDSGSTSSSDPDADRHASIRALGRWLARHSRPDDRAAVIRFARVATASSVVASARLAQGADALAPSPEDGTYTYVGPAVEKAEPILQAVPGAARLVIVITDGETPDASASLQQLQRLADRVVVVALDRDGAWDTNVSSWQVPGVALNEVDNRRPNEIGALLAQHVIAMTGERSR